MPRPAPRAVTCVMPERVGWPAKDRTSLPGLFQGLSEGASQPQVLLRGLGHRAHQAPAVPVRPALRAHELGQGGPVGLLWRSQILQPSECLSGGAGFGAFVDVRRSALASAVVGGVGGPVSGGGSLPGDGDADVDAEQSGEQGCGEFGGEAEQGG